jgi:hypothetical protein
VVHPVQRLRHGHHRQVSTDHRPERPQVRIRAHRPHHVPDPLTAPGPRRRGEHVRLQSTPSTARTRPATGSANRPVPHPRSMTTSWEPSPNTRTRASTAAAGVAGPEAGVVVGDVAAESEVHHPTHAAALPAAHAIPRRAHRPVPGEPGTGL